MPRWWSRRSGDGDGGGIATAPAPAAGKLDKAALAELERAFRGRLIRPGDGDYDEHRRVWNGSIDRSPALIARCAGDADVLAAVRFATATGLPIAVRGGGHSFPGLSTCDGGVIVDLGAMKGIHVDPETRTARVEAGVLWGELDRATQAYGLAVTGGIVTHTGVAGLTLGGGIGWLQRKHGLTIDNLIAADVVTVGGDFVRATEKQHAELFWGLRGAGGNFGVVTEFEFQLHRVGPTVLAGPIFWPVEESPLLLRFYRDWIADAPDELMTIVIHRRAPAVPYVPEELHGELVVAVACCYAGPVEDGEAVVRPLREFGSPVLDLCRPKPYLENQSMFDPSYPHGWWYYVRACDVAELSDDVIDVTAEHAKRIESPVGGFPIWQLGGAVARVGDGDTAFNGRGAGHTFNLTATTKTDDGFEREREWARTFWSALEPHHTSVYVNFLMDEGQDRIVQAYGAEKYARLQALKREYDPDNLLRLNQNIPPA
jgi:FAD/FMN-containing dehydrogenase